MTKMNMREAKAHLSQLVAAAERGETVLLCRDGKPVVELRAVASEKRRTTIDASDLGPPVGRTEALAPLASDDWAR